MTPGVLVVRRRTQVLRSRPPTVRAVSFRDLISGREATRSGVGTVSLRWRLLAVFAVLGALAIGVATLSPGCRRATSCGTRSTTSSLRPGRRDPAAAGASCPQGDRTGPGEGGPGGRGPPSRRTSPPRSSTRTVRSNCRRSRRAPRRRRGPGRGGRRPDGAPTTRLRTVTVDGVELRVLTVRLDGRRRRPDRPGPDRDQRRPQQRRRTDRAHHPRRRGPGRGRRLARRPRASPGPVRALADTAEQVAATQDLGHVHPRAGRATRSAAWPRRSTRCSAPLSDSRRQQQQLIQDASHELRTPLTSLRTSAELLERGHDIDARGAGPPAGRRGVASPRSWATWSPSWWSWPPTSARSRRSPRSPSTRWSSGPQV